MSNRRFLGGVIGAVMILSASGFSIAGPRLHEGGRTVAGPYDIQSLLQGSTRTVFEAKQSGVSTGDLPGVCITLLVQDGPVEVVPNSPTYSATTVSSNTSRTVCYLTRLEKIELKCAGPKDCTGEYRIDIFSESSTTFVAP